MATVYLAQDVKHDRKVALKVLRPELAAVIGAERFLQEIKVTANLQHPHILPLHDSGEADSFLYYVMPYVEGDTLRDKLKRERQLAIEDAIEITRSVASALDYAHRQGVIHRDIKPENVLLHDGQALVADFGIALAVSQASGTRLTETGLSIGTPHYMSPEQAMGDRELDARSDVYSLGAMLYEMLAGDPPYTGTTAQAVVAKVITEKAPPVTAARDTVPPHVTAAIAKALHKMPADRFGTAAAFADALANPAFTVTAVDPPTARPQPWKLAAISSVGVALVAIIAAGWALSRGPVNTGPATYDVGLPDSAPVSLGATIGLAGSPAADFVVYVARRDSTQELWYRSLIDETVRPILGTEGAMRPAVSPAGDEVAFIANGAVRIVPIAGGTARTIAEGLFGSLRWASSTTLLFVGGDGARLRLLDSEGGEIESGPVPYCILAQPLPDGTRLLCGGGGSKNAYIVDPRDSSWANLTPAGDTTGGGLRGAHFRLVDEKYLVYMSVAGDLRATSVDLAAGTVGRSVTMVSGVRRAQGYFGSGQYDITASGTLIYTPGENAEVGWLVKYDGRGVTRLSPEPAAFLRYDITREGRWLAAVVEGVREQELRVYDLATGQRQVWLRDSYIGELLWTPGGERLITWVETDSALVVGSPTETAPPDTLLRGVEFAPMAYWEDDVLIGGGWDVGQTLALDLKTDPPTLDTLLDDASFPMPSPDGKWLAYNSKDLLRLWLSPLPALDRRYQVSVDREDPQWLSPTAFLISDYSGVPTWYLVTVNPSADPPIGEPRPWFSDPRFTGTPGQSYTITPDGGLIYVQGPARQTAAFLRVVPNWVEQMKRAVDGAT